MSKAVITAIILGIILVSQPLTFQNIYADYPDGTIITYGVPDNFDENYNIQLTRNSGYSETELPIPSESIEKFYISLTAGIVRAKIHFTLDGVDYIQPVSPPTLYIFNLPGTYEMSSLKISADRVVERDEKVDLKFLYGTSSVDTDGDGINDENDSCPNQAETVNGYQDSDGCPDEVPTQEPTPENSNFQIDYVDNANDRQAGDSSPVWIQVDVKNEGSDSGTAIVNLEIKNPSGQVVFQDSVSISNIGSGVDKDTVFEWLVPSSANPGIYSYRIYLKDTSGNMHDDEGFSRTFSVSAAPTPEQPFDFSLSLSPQSEIVDAGELASSTLTVGLSSGNPEPVTLTCTVKPNIIGKCTVGPSIINPPEQSSLTITTYERAPSDESYAATVTASGGGKTHSIVFNFDVISVWIDEKPDKEQNVSELSPSIIPSEKTVPNEESIKIEPEQESEQKPKITTETSDQEVLEPKLVPLISESEDKHLAWKIKTEILEYYIDFFTKPDVISQNTINDFYEQSNKIEDDRFSDDLEFILKYTLLSLNFLKDSTAQWELTTRIMNKDPALLSIIDSLEDLRDTTSKISESYRNDLPDRAKTLEITIPSKISKLESSIGNFINILQTKESSIETQSWSKNNAMIDKPISKQFTIDNNLEYISISINQTPKHDWLSFDPPKYSAKIIEKTGDYSQGIVMDGYKGSTEGSYVSPLSAYGSPITIEIIPRSFGSVGFFLFASEITEADITIDVEFHYNAPIDKKWVNQELSKTMNEIKTSLDGFD